MALNKYVVVAGIHYEPAKEPKEGYTHDKFTKDQVVESDRDLEARFPNKFRRFGSIQGPLTQERMQATQRLIDSGVFEEDDREFLHTLPVDNFNHIERKMQQKRQRTTSAPGEEEATRTQNLNNPDKPKQANLSSPDQGEEKGGLKTSIKASEEASGLGNDVTNKFPRSKEAGLKVFKNPAGKHQVVESSHPTRPVNQEPLDSNKDVNDFITEYLEEKKK